MPSEIRDRVLDEQAVLGLQRLVGNAGTAGLLAVQRKAVDKRGGAKYVGPRLEVKLRDMIARGALQPLTEEQIYVLQGMANVESNGKTAAVNTWDNMIVSMGFKQVTLAWGSLYEVMDMAPDAFRRHGIAKSGGTWKISTGQKQVPALEGVDGPEELRSEEWQDRFIAASLDDQIIAALVTFALGELRELRSKLKGKQAEVPPELRHPTAQAWLFEVYNNRPAYAKPAAEAALARARQEGIDDSSDRFLDILAAEIERVYVAREKNKEKAPRKAHNIVTKIPRWKGGASTGPITGGNGSTMTPSAGTRATASAGTRAPATPETDGGLGLLDLIGGVATAVGPAAVRLLVMAGVRDETQLTNLLFWARHPDMVGKKISAGQKASARDWLEIRDQIVAPMLSTQVKDKSATSAEPKEPTVPKGAGGGAATAGSTVGKIRASALGKYGEEGETEFRRRVYAEQMARAETRKEFHPGVAAEDLEEVEDGRFMHKEAAGDGRALLAQVRADLDAAQSAGDKKALSVKSVGVNSAYRSPQTDFSAWQRAFNTHYKRTQADREKLPGGPLGDAAVAFLARHLARYKAVPGFSNHTKGRAIDFSTREDKVSLGASSSQNSRWMQSWLWQWLGANASKFGFRPYKAEAWHWDHR